MTQPNNVVIMMTIALEKSCYYFFPQNLKISMFGRPLGGVNYLTQYDDNAIKCQVPLCGTVCRLRYVHRTRHWTYLKIT